MTAPITVDVFTLDDVTTPIATLPNTWARTFLDAYNDVGSGSFEISLDEVDTSILAYGNLVRLTLEGVHHWFIIEARKPRQVDQSEDLGRTKVISGRGAAALWDDAVVYPELGIGSHSPDARIFNYVSTFYDDSAWTAAVENRLQSDLGPPYRGAPGTDWPDPTAHWIWSRAIGSGEGDAPVGSSYFRKTFNLPADSWFAIYATCDNKFELYLDDAPILTQDEGWWTEMQKFTMFLPAGNHLLAVRGINLPGNPGTDPASFLLAGFETDDHGTLGTLRVHTDNTWKALDYPAKPPGMTPGKILRLLLEEAQARGTLAGVSLDFTDTLDSGGEAWEEIEQSYDVGTPYVTVLRALAEVAPLDFAIDRTDPLKLRAWKQRGVDRSATVKFEPAVNITELEHQGSFELINAALGKFARGWQEASDAGSIATYRRREGYVSVGTAPSEEQTDATLQALLVDHAKPKDSATLGFEVIEGGAVPFVDFDVGDLVGAPSEAGALIAYPLRGLTISEDDNGEPIYTPELGTLVVDDTDRTQRWLRRMVDGTLSGQVESAAPPWRIAAKRDTASTSVPPSGGGGHGHDGAGAHSTIVGGTAEADPGVPIASDQFTVALGDYASATKIYAIAIGAGDHVWDGAGNSAPKASLWGSVVIGNFAADGDNPGSTLGDVVIGLGATANGGDYGGGGQNVVIGWGAFTGAGASVAIGSYAQATGEVSVAIGADTVTNDEFQVVIGDGSSAGWGTGHVIVGESCDIQGSANEGDPGFCVAVGDQVNIGYVRPFTGDRESPYGAIGMGHGTVVYAGATSAIAIGSNEPGMDPIYGEADFGAQVRKDAAYAIAIGALAIVDQGHSNSVALGHAAATTAADQIMLGIATHRVHIPTPNSAPADDAEILNGFITGWLDEASDKLTFRVRYSDGTLKTGSVNLT